MAYSIEDHVQDHARYIRNNLTINKTRKITPFVTSVDTAYFIIAGYDTQEKIDKVMIEIVDNIVDEGLMVYEKNGKDKNDKQLCCNRKIHFDKLLFAYHNAHFDATKNVKPHFHILFDKTSRMGRGFTNLKKVLNNQADKYKIKFHFSEPKQVQGISSWKMKGLETLGWFLHQGKQEKLSRYLEDTTKIDKHLSSLITHYQHTKNISFFLKTLLILNQRLEEYNVDYYHQGINLKDNIFFLLDQNDRDLLDDLRLGKTIDIDMSSVLSREILSHTYGFQNNIIDILMCKFDINHIDKSQLNTKHIVIDNLIKADYKSTGEFKKLIILDILNALKNATSEGEVKSLLIDTGSYSKVSMKTQKNVNNKRSKIGFVVTTKKKTKMFVSFSDLNMTWSEIMFKLMTNKENKINKESKKINSHIKNYSVPVKEGKDEDFTLYQHRIKVLLKIYNNSSDTNINIDKVESLARRYKIHRSEMYNVTTLENDATIIVDTNETLTLKKSNNIKESVLDMLEVAVLKNWDLSQLNVSGAKEFVAEAKKQINSQLSLGKKSEQVTARKKPNK